VVFSWRPIVASLLVIPALATIVAWLVGAFFTVAVILVASLLIAVLPFALFVRPVFSLLVFASLFFFVVSRSRQGFAVHGLL
jgi:hypothetical protein